MRAEGETGLEKEREESSECTERRDCAVLASARVCEKERRREREREREEQKKRKEVESEMQAVQQGYLWKKGKVTGQWIRRWYALEDGVLYYSEEADAYCATSLNGQGDVGGARHSGSPSGNGGGRRNVLDGTPVVRCQALPVQHYNGKTLLGLRIITVEGESKDLYTTSHSDWQSWARSIKRRNTTSLDDDYAVEDMIGSGAFSTVHRARHLASGQMVALKVIEKKSYKKCSSLLEKEITVMHLLDDHKNIVKLREVLTTPYEVVVAMDLCDGGNLVEGMSKLTYTEAAIANIVRQIVDGLAYLHARSICHRDLKPENIVFETKPPCDSIKIIDFGMASFFNQGTLVSGTPHYMAPEIISDPHTVAQRGCGPEVDMWALGCLTYFLLTGETPFKGKTNDEVFNSVIVGKWSFSAEHEDIISPVSRDVVTELLSRDPKDRPTAAELMQHRWISGSVWRDTLLEAASKNMAEVMEYATSTYMSMRRSSDSNGDSSNPNHSRRFKTNSNNISIPIFNKASEHEVREFASKMISFAEDAPNASSSSAAAAAATRSKDEMRRQHEQRLRDALDAGGAMSTSGENRNTWANSSGDNVGNGGSGGGPNLRSASQTLSRIFCCGRSKLYRRDSLEHLTDYDDAWSTRVSDFD